MVDKKEVEKEIYQALEEAINTPVGDSLEAKVEEVPETIEQVLDLFEQNIETSYDKQVHYLSEQEETSYPYEAYESDYELEDNYSASYHVAVEDKETMETAEAMIENAILKRTLGLSNAYFHVTNEQKAKVENFKSMHLGEWFVMCANPHLYVLS